MTAAALSVTGLVAGYGRAPVLRGIDMHVESGECVAIIGANGAGKSTLLRAVVGLLRPVRGSAKLSGAEMLGKDAEAIVRAGLTLVPEGRGVFPSLSVDENLILGAYHWRRRGDVAAARASVLDVFPLLGERLHQSAGTLSGGEQQMLAIGRGLMSRPTVMLLDEPCLGLAPLAIGHILERLKALVEEGMTMVVVEQNARAVLSLADRAYVVHRGQVVKSGSGPELADAAEVRKAYFGP